VVNAVPFGARDASHIRIFADKLDRSILPRPQGALATITVRPAQPEKGLPPAFDAFRQILRTTGANWAALSAPYESCLWAAIRAGWREGYSVETEPIRVSSDSDMREAREKIRASAGCTRFSVDASQSFGLPAGVGQHAWLAEQLAKPIPIGEAIYAFEADEIARLAARYGRMLELAEELHDLIRRTKSPSGLGRGFDFELSLAGSEAPTTGKNLVFCLQWLKTKGRAVQLVAPGANPGALAELAAVARHFNATLSLGAGEEELEAIGRAAKGRVNYTLSGDFDAAHIVRVAARLRG
jgi:hypothetical protein